MLNSTKWEISKSEINSVNDSFIHPVKYIINSKLKIYEDNFHEFKEFKIKNIKDVEIRVRSISKYVCAFLNSNSGCLYIGIDDDGIVKGTELNDELLFEFKAKIEAMINQYDDYVVQQNLISINIAAVYQNKFTKPINELYIIEIFVKKGLCDYIYTTIAGDTQGNDYQCFIKLNGTIKKIDGMNLYYYIKNKIKKIYSKKENNNNIDNVDNLDDFYK